MKSILMSVQPKWCELIASDKKTIEVRKTVPKLQMPFKCYIYATQGKDILRLGDRYIKEKGKDTIHTKVCFIQNLDYCSNEIINGKVVGEFVCEKVTQIKSERKYNSAMVAFDVRYNIDLSTTGLTEAQLTVYCGEPIQDEVSDNYLKVYYKAWALHISQLKIYDKPKELGEFKKYNRTCLYSDLGYAIPNCTDCKQCNLKKPPQSWCYVEEIENERV